MSSMSPVDAAARVREQLETRRRYPHKVTDYDWRFYNDVAVVVSLLADSERVIENLKEDLNMREAGLRRIAEIPPGFDDDGILTRAIALVALAAVPDGPVSEEKP